MSKIKVLFQVNQLANDETERAVFEFCRLLDSSLYDPYLFVYTDKGTGTYYWKSLKTLFNQEAKDQFKQQYADAFVNVDAFVNLVDETRFYTGIWSDFKNVVNTLQPQIVHFNRSEEVGFMTEKKRFPSGPTYVETCFTGKPASADYIAKLRKIFFVTNNAKNAAESWHAGKGVSLFAPVKAPMLDADLREELGIPADAFVIGYTGDANQTVDDFLVSTYQVVKAPNTFLLLSGVNIEVTAAFEFDNHIKNLAPNLDGESLSKYYNTIDVFIHSRGPKEYFSREVAEAMIHRKPVISLDTTDLPHNEMFSPEDFGPVGFVEKSANVEKFATDLVLLRTKDALCKQVGRNAQRKALSLFEEGQVTKHLQKEYWDLMKQAN